MFYTEVEPQLALISLGNSLTNCLPQIGVTGRVDHVAGDSLAGPGAGGHSHQAAAGVEPRMPDRWKVLHAAVQGSRVPGYGHRLREIAFGQAS